MSQPESASSKAGMSLGTFVVLLLLSGTYVSQLSFTHVQLRTESEQLEAQFTQQTPQLESAQQLRTQFDGIAGDLAALAESGNENAVKIREQLAAQGVQLRAPAAPAAEAAAGEATAGDNK